MSGTTARVLDFARPFFETGPAAAREVSVTALAGDGSGRRYFRIEAAGVTRVAILNPLGDGRGHPDENEGFLAVRDLLQARGVRVPAFFGADLEGGLILIEDLGDERLCDRVEREGWGAWPSGSLPALYGDTLRALVRMHAPVEPAFDPCIAPNPEYTGPFVLEWEADYFHRELVRGWLGLDESFERIEADCRRLAGEALSEHERRGRPAVFMHRDYQSRNIMITGEGAAVIDFQGGRAGPPEYDLAALLYDPYIAMPEGVRLDLVRSYAREAALAGVPGVPADLDSTAGALWRRRFLANAANRLMQALGAYGKLGGRFGRPGFIEHVPCALAHLEGVLAERKDCPALLALVRELRSREGCA